MATLQFSTKTKPKATKATTGALLMNHEKIYRIKSVACTFYLALVSLRLHFHEVAILAQATGYNLHSSK